MSATRDIWKKVPQSIYYVLSMGGQNENPGTPDVQSTEVRLRRDNTNMIITINKILNN